MPRLNARSDARDGDATSSDIRTRRPALKTRVSASACTHLRGNAMRWGSAIRIGQNFLVRRIRRIERRFSFRSRQTLFRSILHARSRPRATLLQRRATHVTVRTTPTMRSRPRSLASRRTRSLDPRPPASASRVSGVDREASRSSFGCVARRWLAGAGDRAVPTARAGHVR